MKNLIFKKILVVGVIIFTALLTLTMIAEQKYKKGDCKTGATQKVKESNQTKPQSVCPVMGGKVTKESSFVDVKGYRIYLCCPGCAGKVKKDPDKYIKKILRKGETPAKTPEKVNKEDGKNSEQKGKQED